MVVATDHDRERGVLTTHDVVQLQHVRVSLTAARARGVLPEAFALPLRAPRFTSGIPLHGVDSQVTVA
jgi:hypothetical protein